MLRAISHVRSVEPESSTCTSSHHAQERRQSAMFDSSSFVRMTTDTGGARAASACEEGGSSNSVMKSAIPDACYKSAVYPGENISPVYCTPAARGSLSHER